MLKISHLNAIALSIGLACSQSAIANEFGFDRPGEAFGTSIVPKGKFAWEQALPSATYDESRVNGIKQTQINVQGDVLLRAGIGYNTELRLGWDGPMWQRNKAAGVEQDTDGVGDIQIGIKKAIDLNDEKLNWALLAEVTLATGDDGFSEEEEIYTLGSSLEYQFDANVTTGLTMLYDYQDGNLAVTAIPNIEYPIAGRVSGFSEYVYHKAEHKHYESAVNTGLKWSPIDQLQLDAQIGYSFNQQRPDFSAGLGASYLF